MSGLVTGLQNRAQRFESASDLNKKAPHYEVLFPVFRNEPHKSVLGDFDK